MEPFYLVQNPGGDAGPASEVRYLLPNGAEPVVRTYTVDAGSRATIWVDREDQALACDRRGGHDHLARWRRRLSLNAASTSRDAGSTAPRGGDTQHRRHRPGDPVVRRRRDGPLHDAAAPRQPRFGARRRPLRFSSAPTAVRVSRSYRLAPNSRQTIDVASVHPSLFEHGAGHHGGRERADCGRAHQVVGRERHARRGRQRQRLRPAAAARWLLAEAELGGGRQATSDSGAVQHGRGEGTWPSRCSSKLALRCRRRSPSPRAPGFDVPLAQAFPAAANCRFSVLVEGADPLRQPDCRLRDLLAGVAGADSDRRRRWRGDAPAVTGLRGIRSGSIAAGTRTACPAASLS